MSEPTRRLRRSDRLRRASEFRRTARTGRRLVCDAFVVLISDQVETTRGPTRLGMTASRKVGNAVVRNRIKRGIREWFRHSRTRLESARDVVVIARKTASRLNCIEINTKLEKLVTPSTGSAGRS